LDETLKFGWNMIRFEERFHHGLGIRTRKILKSNFLVSLTQTGQLMGGEEIEGWSIGTEEQGRKPEVIQD
jgi:hypothetical protein